MIIIGFFNNLAEAVRFELTNPFGSPVFKTGAFNHSATLPVVAKNTGCCLKKQLFLSRKVFQMHSF